MTGSCSYLRRCFEPTSGIGTLEIKTVFQRGYNSYCFLNLIQTDYDHPLVSSVVI